MPHSNASALATSIFLPFTSFSTTPITTTASGDPTSPNKPPNAPLENTQKLTLILKNLTAQQEAVKRNILYVTSQRANRLREDARLALENFEADDDEVMVDTDDGEGERGEGARRGEMKNSIDAMFAAVKKGKPKGSKGEDFEFVVEGLVSDKPASILKKVQPPGTTNPLIAPAINPNNNNNIDTEMSGTGPIPAQSWQNLVNQALTKNKNTRSRSPPPPPQAVSRTPSEILRGLSREMMNLVDVAVTELQRQDKRGKETIAHFQQALDRRVGRRGSEGGGGGSGGGVKKEVEMRGGGGKVEVANTGAGTGSGSASGQDSRRKSIPGIGIGIGMTPQSRVMETMEEISRRGSR